MLTLPRSHLPRPLFSKSLARKFIPDVRFHKSDSCGGGGDWYLLHHDPLLQCRAGVVERMLQSRQRINGFREQDNPPRELHVRPTVFSDECSRARSGRLLPMVHCQLPGRRGVPFESDECLGAASCDLHPGSGHLQHDDPSTVREPDASFIVEVRSGFARH